jgi:glutamate synthase (NADPH/NADH) large chain
MSLATSIGREMNVFCEAEGQAHRELQIADPAVLRFQTAHHHEEEHYRADTLDITFNVTETSLEDGESAVR